MRRVGRLQDGEGATAGVRGQVGEGTSADLVTSIGEEAEEKEVFVFKTASSPALQRRLSTVRSARCTSGCQKAVVAPGPPRFVDWALYPIFF